MRRNPLRGPLPPSVLQRLVKIWGPGGGRGGSVRGGQQLQYFDPETGGTHSRRQVEQSGALGGVSWEEHAIRNRVRSILNRETGLPLVYDERFGVLVARYGKTQHVTKRQALRRDSPFWTALEDLTRGHRGSRTRTARALVTFGLRRATWRQDVGQSPEPAPTQLTAWMKQHIAATYDPAPAPFTGPAGRAPVLARSTRERRPRGRPHPRHSN